MSPRVRVKLCVKRQSITTTRPLDNSNSDSNLLQNNNNTKLLSSDLKALHSIFIRELYKDRKAPVKPFSSLQSAASYFNVNYRTIRRHLDTKLSTIQNKTPPPVGVWYILYRHI